jgi:WD40 repeat protein
VPNTLLLEFPGCKVIQKFPGFSDPMAITADGQTLAVVREDKLNFYDKKSGLEVKSIVHPGGQVRKLMYAPKDKTFITRSDDNTIRFWDAATYEETRRFDVVRSGSSDMVLATENLLVASRHTHIHVWDIASGRQIALLNEGTSLQVWDLVLDPDEKWLIGSFSDQSIRRWDISGSGR